MASDYWDEVVPKLIEAGVVNATTFTCFGTTFSGVKNSCELVFHTDARYCGRYIQLSAVTGTSGVTNENATISAIGTLTRLDAAPATAAAEVTGTYDQVQINAPVL